MVEYKWVALSNTTIGTLMATVNGTITLISLPAIFKGISLSPFQAGNIIYLLWILMGFNIVTATLLVTFGRLSDIYGRVKLFNLGFAIFTFGSVMLFLTPGTGARAAQFLVAFRLVQGVGAAFLFSNSAAILTDAFPLNERGKALGINAVAALAGSFVGLILGGILSVIDWRLVFLVSVPIGLLGTVWSIFKLKDTSIKLKGQKIDYVGNITFAGGLTILLIGVTYGLLPYNGSTMGWSNPLVIAALVIGLVLIGLFPWVETKVKQPMFRMELFKIRAFAAGNFASLLSAIGRGGVMLMLIILLQGIYLPLHGYAYSVTPLWAGIFMVPMTMGFLVMGPISGIISDKHGARTLATAGMVIVGSMFIVLAIMPFNFSYPEFALALFFMGIGNGMFASPNTAAIMNSVPSDARGSASGMRSTLMNAGMTASLGMFFTIVLLNLHADLPGSLSSAVSKLSLPSSLSSSLNTIFHSTPPTVALFSAFLGLNPMTSLITSTSLISGLKSAGVYTIITGHSWFPNALAPAFIDSLHVAFYVGIVISFVAAIVSALRGKKYAHADADYVGKETNKSSEGINISEDSVSKGYPDKAKPIVRNTSEVKK